MAKRRWQLSTEPFYRCRMLCYSVSFIRYRITDFVEDPSSPAPLNLSSSVKLILNVRIFLQWALTRRSPLLLHALGYTLRYTPEYTMYLVHVYFKTSQKQHECFFPQLVFMDLSFSTLFQNVNSECLSNMTRQCSMTNFSWNSVSVRPSVSPSITHELKPCKSAVFD